MSRNIFEYWNGVRNVKCDPMRIANEFAKVALEINFDSLLTRFLGPPWLEHLGDDAELARLGVTEGQIKIVLKEKALATDEVIKVICRVFGVKHLDEDEENGMTGAELLDAFRGWIQYSREVKKNIEMSASDSPGTGSRPESPTTTKDGKESTVFT